MIKVIQPILRYWPITLGVISILFSLSYSADVIQHNAVCLAYLCTKNQTWMIAFNLFIGLYLPIYIAVALPLRLFLKQLSLLYVFIISLLALIFSIIIIVTQPLHTEWIINSLELFLFLD